MDIILAIVVVTVSGLSLLLCVRGLGKRSESVGKKSLGGQRIIVSAVNRPSISRQEVALHKSEDDLWLIIDGKVYDLTSYVDGHPGGLSIMKNAGADSSEGFHGDQHPDRLEQMLDDFYVGDLEKTD